MRTRKNKNGADSSTQILLYTKMNDQETKSLKEKISDDTNIVKIGLHQLDTYKSYIEKTRKFGAPLSIEVIIGYIDIYNTLFFVRNDEVLALLSFAFIDNKTGLISEEITDHVHFLSIVNNSDITKGFVDKMMNTFRKFSYISLNPLIQTDYVRLTDFYRNKGFAYINNETCSESGTCVLVYDYKPGKSDRKNSHPTCNFFINQTEISNHVDIVPKNKNGRIKIEDITWTESIHTIKFRLLSHDIDDRRDDVIRTVHGIEMIEWKNLTKDTLEKFAHCVFNINSIPKKIFVTRIPSTKVYNDLTELGFKNYIDCQDNETSEYCRMVRHTPQISSSSSSSFSPIHSSSNTSKNNTKSSSSSNTSRNNTSPSNQPVSNQISQSSSSSNTSRNNMSPSNQPVSNQIPKSSSSSNTSRNNMSPSNQPVSNQISQFGDICKSRSTRGSTGGSTGKSTGGPKHPEIFNSERDANDANISRFRVMMRLSLYIKQDLGFTVLKNTNNRYEHFLIDDKSFFIINSHKSADIPEFRRSLNLIVECDKRLRNNNSREQDHYLYHGKNIEEENIEEVNIDEMNEEKIIERNLVDEVINTHINQITAPKFFTFKVHCFARSDGPMKVELIPSKEEDVQRAIFKFVRGIVCKTDGGEVRPASDFKTFGEEVASIQSKFGVPFSVWYSQTVINPPQAPQRKKNTAKKQKK